jgi:hypothetical protein
MKPGDICLVLPVGGLLRCPVWCSESLDDPEGIVIDVYPDTLCTVLSIEELTSKHEGKSELWARALFPQHVGWIPICDLKVINDESR